MEAFKWFGEKLIGTYVYTYPSYVGVPLHNAYYTVARFGGPVVPWTRGPRTGYPPSGRGAPPPPLHLTLWITAADGSAVSLSLPKVRNFAHF